MKRWGSVLLPVLFVGMAATAFAQTQPATFFGLVETGTPQAVQAAIDKGADVGARDPRGLTPLMIAAASNPDPAVTVALLKAGADVRALEPSWGRNVLMVAAKTNNSKVIAALLGTGIGPNMTDRYGYTALEIAAENNPDPDVIRTLARAGATVNTGDQDFVSPLGRAVWGNNIRVISALLDAGANPNALAASLPTYSALAAAVMSNPDPNVIIVLLKAGADAKADMRDTSNAAAPPFLAIDLARDNEKLKGTEALRMLEEASK